MKNDVIFSEEQYIDERHILQVALVDFVPTYILINLNLNWEMIFPTFIDLHNYLKGNGDAFRVVYVSQRNGFHNDMGMSDTEYFLRLKYNYRQPENIFSFK